MTTDSKNLYESIIQDMIVDGIDGMTPAMKKVIKNAPVEKQREMILAIMEENNPEHRLLCNKIRKVVKENKTGETSHIAGIVKMLREYVKVSDVEVKTMGEVMTPIELVEEMLDTLPYEVWTNPNLKWLDPCNGVGTFLSVVVKRLMKGLEGFEADAELRYQHIMENMIYSCELQPKNVFLYMYAFDPCDEFAMNVFNGSYLSEDFDRHMGFWGVEKFDVIVMNPPYNGNSENRVYTLWDRFVKKSIENHLINGGYLLAVHPSSWRNVNSKNKNGTFSNVQALLKEKQIIYLEMHNTTDGLKTFGANTTYDWYCLHNVPNTMFTKIKTYNGKIERADISVMEFIPNVNIEFVFSLIAKNGEEKIKFIKTCDYHTQKDSMSKEQNENFKYPCVYTVGAKNPNFWYCNTKEKYFVPKVIWGNGLSDVIVDEAGEYGLTQFAYAIVDEPKNLPFIQKALKSERFIKEVMGYTKGVGHIYNYKVIATFRKDFWKEFLY
jgi:hypothetical protein